MWAKVKAGFTAFSATTRDTFGCTGNYGNAIDDDDDSNFVADGNGAGSSSQPAFVEIDFLRSDLNHQRHYPDNSIRTAKYTLASGLPLSLLYQFYKISNFYFLLVMVITLVPGASPINPFSSVVPLCIVLGAGIIKDLWEDWKRRKADQLANEMIVHVLRVPMQSGVASRARSTAHTAATADAAAAAATSSPTNAEPASVDRSGHIGDVDPMLLRHMDETREQQQGGVTTSDSDVRNEANETVIVDSGGGAGPTTRQEPPSRDRKRKRVVRFLFPSERTRTRSIEMVEAGEQTSQQQQQPSSSTVTSKKGNDDVAAAAAATTETVPAQPTQLKSRSQHHSKGGSGSAAAAASSPSASHETRVTFQPIRSCDVYPGDIMLFRLGEEVKADCIILNTSLPDGLTYIETANLDGETNAKTRRAKIQTVEALGTVEDIIERSLGVPAFNAAAVFAKMNGGDTANGLGFVDGSAGADPPSKAVADSCGTVGALHVVSTPAQEANNAAVAAAAHANAHRTPPLSELEALARHPTPLGPAQSEEEKKRLLSHVTSSTSDTAGSPSEERDGESPVDKEAAARKPRSPAKDGEGPCAFVPSTHLEREESEAGDGGLSGHGHGHTSYQHRRCLSDPAQPTDAHPRSTLPLIVSGADLTPAASEALFGTGSIGTPGDLALDRARHQRHLTLDERLMEEGAIPVPRHVRELSAQYERAMHSRTSSIGAHPSQPHASVSSRTRRGDTSLYDDADSVLVDGESNPRRHVWGSSSIGASQRDSSLRQRSSAAERASSAVGMQSAGERSRAANSSHVTVRNSDGVSGGGGDDVTPAEACGNMGRPNAFKSDEAGAAAPASSSGVVLVSCAPTPDLSMWFGQLRMPSGEMVPLGIDQFIPRGCLIRNTDWVLGAVVYTGRHTKMLLNLRPKPNKITNMTRRLNQLNVFLFLLNQSLMFALCGLSIWSKHYLLRQEPDSKSAFAAWYIQWSLNRYSDATLFWWRYLTNFVLLSYLIPMSLYVTLEFNKAMQMLMIGADKRMAVFDEFTGAIKNARPKTSELNCQLGYVRYIFTDKTGTLTENLMTYVGGVVDGHTHSETEQPGGIGRALLKRRGGGGGGGGGGGSSNNNNNMSSVNAMRRVLSTGDDLLYTISGLGGFGSGMDSSATFNSPTTRRALRTAATGQNVSTFPADGGEAPNTSHGPMLDPSTYQMPPALTGPDVQPNMTANASDLPSSPLTLNRPRSTGASPLAARGSQQQQRHRHTGSTDSLTRLADQMHIHNGSSIPAFGTPGTAHHLDHPRVGSGVGLPAPGSAVHHGVPSGSAHQWGSGTFGGFGAGGGGGDASGTYGGGLSHASEAVLERDPLFRYLRALALCHSIVCFPVHGESTAASEAGENESLNRSAGDASAATAAAATTTRAAAMRGDAVELTKAERKQQRRERRAERKAKMERRDHDAANTGSEGDGSPTTQTHHPHHAGEEREGATGEATKTHKKHRHHQHHHRHAKEKATGDHRDPADIGAAAHSRQGSAIGLPPVSSLLSLSNISAANFVEIPYAVPSGPPRSDYEPYTHSPTTTTTNVTRGDNEPVTVESSAALRSRRAHVRSGSATSPAAASPAPPSLPVTHLADSGVFNLSATNLNKLHGRTSSASWYQNRYLNRVMHSRNFSQNSNTNQLLRTVTSNSGGGPGSPLTSVNARMLRNGVSRSVAEGASDVAGAGVWGLEAFIDRTKLYEGQSLDEIALVNAARENGFSLVERTAKQMYVKALGRLMCYDIIAELEFTPQRKLMSILLQRRPELDSEDAATTAASGTSAHYHRKTEDQLAAEQQQQQQQAAAAEAASMPYSGNTSASLFHPPAARSQTAYHHAQERATHCPFTPDAPALETAIRGGGAADSYLGRQQQQQQLDHPPSLPRPRSQPILEEHSLDLSHLGAHHARTFSAFASPPWAGLQLPGSVNESGAVLHPTSGASGAPKYLLLVKGADSSMMEIVNMQKKANARVKEKMLAELDAMAQLGLRTLVLGQRYLSEEEVRAWLPVFNEAQCAMQDRNDRLHQAYALIEKNVDIVGTTAVEDKLQDEVPQTLEFCIQASIVVWMLTGDKRETAVTIAHTSGLVSAAYTEYVCHLDVSDIVEEEALLKQQRQYEERARVKKANGETEESDDDDEEKEGDDNDNDDAVSVSPSQTSKGQPLSTPTASKSNEVNSATQPLPGLSSESHSPGPQSARTNAGVDCGTGGAAKSLKSVPDPSSTATVSSFMDRKLARIEAQLAAAEEKCSEGQELFNAHVVVVVVDGKTLDFIFQDNARAHRFFLLGSRCRSAVCCRMTPLQKAKIVRMFKRNMNAVALAIGDGANDVSMIQESSIGVGIMGLEGSQAELASDYAIPKFRFLKRLLFVHGRFSVFREAHCIIYSLYKNVIVTVGMIAYQFYACYSGQALMDSWLLAMFSIFFCSLQPLMIGILDKDVEDELAESLPKLYPPLSREFMYFSFPYIGKWLLDGLVEGLIFFFVLMYTVGVQDNLYPHMTPAIEDYGTTFFTMLVLVADFRVGTLVTYYMVLFALAVSLEIVFVPVIELIYSAMNNLAGSNWCVKVANELYGTSGKFWMMLFFACGVLVVVTMASNMYIQIFYPWQNAGFAMRAARASSHRVPYERMKRELKAEYAGLLARYEALRQQHHQLGEMDGANGGEEEGDDTVRAAATKKT